MQSPSWRSQQGKWPIGLQRPRPVGLLIQPRPCPSSQHMLESLWGWPYGPNRRSRPTGLIKPCPSFFFFFQSILHWSAAVSTICRHSSRVVVFLQAVARPKFRGLNCMEPSVARSSNNLLVASSRAVLVGGLDGGPRKVNCKQYGRRAADIY